MPIRINLTIRRYARISLYSHNFSSKVRVSCRPMHQVKQNLYEQAENCHLYFQKTLRGVSTKLQQFNQSGALRAGIITHTFHIYLMSIAFIISAFLFFETSKPKLPNILRSIVWCNIDTFYRFFDMFIHYHRLIYSRALTFLLHSSALTIIKIISPVFCTRIQNIRI